MHHAPSDGKAKVQVKQTPFALVFGHLVHARFRIQTPGVQLKPSPVPLGLCVARMGSVMPRPSGPRPIPGFQPMLCNIRLPMLESGIGDALSPTTPETRGRRSETYNISSSLR
ncbi:hypothetical protein EYF80_028212 [Liparis tanakae]|uniref:Uncharacterized protein n=1 Tax=Liparis tanakae TaxID=230148 RepID=A0A4Z2H7W2_9TELE|nr:hypothetical protein EYF80_028212 [Liparis tanakae]